MPDLRGASQVTHARLLLLAAALLWSTSGLFVKSPLLQEIPISQRGAVLACYRAVFAALFLLPFVRRRHVRWRPMLVPMAITFAVMNVLFLTAMTQTTAAAAIFLQYTSTVWALVFGFVFLKERVDRGNIVALTGAIIGIGWIVAADWAGENFAGNLIALGSGLAYAGVILSLRQLRDEDSAWLVMLNHAIAALILFPWAWSLGPDLRASQWAVVALFGIVQMALPYVLFARGVRFVTAQEAALLTLIEPILNPLWVWIFWREVVPPATWIGGGFILGGLAARYTVFAPPTVRRDDS